MEDAIVVENNVNEKSIYDLVSKEAAKYSDQHKTQEDKNDKEHESYDSGYTYTSSLLNAYMG